MVKLSLNVVPNVYNSLQSSFLSFAPFTPWLQVRSLPKWKPVGVMGPLYWRPLPGLASGRSTLPPPMPPTHLGVLMTLDPWGPMLVLWAPYIHLPPSITPLTPLLIPLDTLHSPWHAPTPLSVGVLWPYTWVQWWSASQLHLHPMPPTPPTPLMAPTPPTPLSLATPMPPNTPWYHPSAP